MLVGAFAAIVLLTWALVMMNTRSVVLQFTRDHNLIRLYSYLTALLIMGSLIIAVASAVIQRVIDTETLLNSDATSPARYFRR